MSDRYVWIYVIIQILRAQNIASDIWISLCERLWGVNISLEEKRPSLYSSVVLDGTLLFQCISSEQLLPQV